MLHFIYFFSTNISTEYFKHAAHSIYIYVYIYMCIYIYIAYSVFVSNITSWIVCEDKDTISIRNVWGISEAVHVCCAVCCSGPKDEPLPDCQRYLPTYPAPELNSDNCSTLELWNQGTPVLRNTKKSSREFVLIMESGCVCMVWCCLYRLVLVLWDMLLLQLPLFSPHNVLHGDITCFDVLCAVNSNCVAIHLVLYEQAMCHQVCDQSWSYIVSMASKQGIRGGGGRSNETLIDLLAN